MKVLARARVRDWRVAALLLAAAAVSLAPSIGDASPDAASVTVDTAGIDTSTDAGVQALYRRIRAAAADVCGPEFRSPRLTRLRNECIDAAVESAVADANRSQLTALHQKTISRTGP